MNGWELFLGGSFFAAVFGALLNFFLSRARRDAELNAQAMLELERRRKLLEPQVAEVHARQRSEHLQVEGLREASLRVAADNLDQAELELEARTGEPWIPYPRGQLPKGPNGS